MSCKEKDERNKLKRDKETEKFEILLNMNESLFIRTQGFTETYRGIHTAVGTANRRKRKEKRERKRKERKKDTIKIAIESKKEMQCIYQN